VKSRNIAVILISLLAFVVCRADIITVKDDGSGDYPTIQAAINAGSDGDVIELQPGIYTGQGNRDIEFDDKAVTVRSIDPNNFNIAAATIIDCNGTQDEYHRGFYFHNNEGPEAVVEGVKIIGGYAEYGGAIYCDGDSSPTIINCIISQNTAADGGGIYNEWDSSPTISNCIFTDNFADGAGGGIYNYNCFVSLSNCVFSENGAGWYGGGIYNEDSSPELTDCTFSWNSAGDGGGVYNEWGSCPNLVSCTFSNNSAQWDGGGMYNDDSGPELTDCLFSGNSADWYGGGIYNDHSSPNLVRCTFSGNSSDDEGGGICNKYSSPIVTNCTFSGNSAISRGGGIYNYNSSSDVTNCILWSNAANNGAQIALMSNSTLTINYSNVQDGVGGVYVEYSQLEWGNGNINVDPCFAEPGNNDYHLKSEGLRWNSTQAWVYDDVTSRCIDAGNPGFALGKEVLSVSGELGGRTGENVRINMGAYGGAIEASIPPYDWILLADLTNDGIVNLEDFAVQATNWLESASRQPGDLNRDGTVGINDLGMFAEDWLKQTNWSGQ